MGVNINISGTTINENATVLNGLKIQGQNDTDINIKNSSVRGKSQILNGVNISGNSSVNIEIENSDITGNSRILNGLDVENDNVDVELKDLNLGKDVEFMNDKKFRGNTSHKQNTYEQDTSEKTTSTTVKKDGFLKRVLKSILNLEDMEDASEEITYSKKSHKDFEDELSRGGNFKNLDMPETSHSAETSKGKQKNTDRGR